MYNYYSRDVGTLKKLIKNNLFGFILGAIIFGSIGVAASQLFANDIGYTPIDTTWQVDNVKDAIDDLYGNIIKGEILYEEGLYDTTSLTSKSYEFTEKRNAILIVSASHGNNNNSYYHQLNIPTITGGEMKQLYSIGNLNEQVNGGNIFSEYAYFIKANEGTKIEVKAKAYGWGNYKIKIIG